VRPVDQTQPLLVSCICKSFVISRAVATHPAAAIIRLPTQPGNPLRMYRPDRAQSERYIVFTRNLLASSDNNIIRATHSNFQTASAWLSPAKAYSFEGFEDMRELPVSLLDAAAVVIVLVRWVIAAAAVVARDFP
jgi:hypothetical protein